MNCLRVDPNQDAAISLGLPLEAELKILIRLGGVNISCPFLHQSKGAVFHSPSPCLQRLLGFPAVPP